MNGPAEPAPDIGGSFSTLRSLVFDEAAEAKCRSWLSDELLPREHAPAVFEGEVSGWFARERISRPGGYRLDRVLRSARAAYDDAALKHVGDCLVGGMRERLDALLANADGGSRFARLEADPGRSGWRAC